MKKIDEINNGQLKYLKAEGSNVNYLKYLNSDLWKKDQIQSVMLQTINARINDWKLCGVTFWFNERKNLLRIQVSPKQISSPKINPKVCVQDEAR